VPQHFADIQAIGPGGEYTGFPYSHYEAQAQLFCYALFEVYDEGDGAGRPFFFPKPILHITERFFQTQGAENFLRYVCAVSSKRGNPYFVFDRGDTAKISQCCRLSVAYTEQDLSEAKFPWKMRFTALQNVTINLPRMGYLSDRTEKSVMEQIEKHMRLAATAHQEKLEFLRVIMEYGAHGPYALLAMNHDGEPYLRLNRTKYLIGIVGLNELVQTMIGKQLHEHPKAMQLGLRIIARMQDLCNKLTKETGMKIVLEQTPAESTAYRFASLDLERFPEAAHVVKGSILRDEIYYTNSTHLAVDAPVSPMQRMRDEAKFHRFIDAGSITHIWVGENRPYPDALANAVKEAFQTECSQLTFSPEFTCCNDCYQTARGLITACPFCGSEDVDGITRITGYFTKISSWNKGKIGELRDRHRYTNHFKQGEQENA
jgi:ribonucleoside-triphosphate reductase